MLRFVMALAIAYVCWQNYQASIVPPAERPASFETFLDWR